MGTEDPDRHVNKKDKDDLIAGTGKIVTVHRPVAVPAPGIERVSAVICSTGHRAEGLCNSTFCPGGLCILGMLCDRFFVSQSKAKLRNLSFVG